MRSIAPATAACPGQLAAQRGRALPLVAALATLLVQACELPVTVGRECAAESCTDCEPSQRPLDMHLVFDTSGLQVFSWNDMQRGLAQFMADPASRGVGLGLRLFAESCEAAGYETPTVPIAPLPENGSAVLAAFPLAPTPDSAVRPVLEGAIRYARAWQQTHERRSAIVTLVTDGIPNDKCDSSAEKLSEVVREGLAGSPSIRTFVVSIDSLGSIFGFVSQVTAASGGPAVMVPVQSAEDLAQAFGRVRDEASASAAATGCEAQ